jgi:hypothetical protein
MEKQSVSADAGSYHRTSLNVKIEKQILSSRARAPV